MGVVGIHQRVADGDLLQAGEGDDAVAVVDPERCVGCAICLGSCAFDAIVGLGDESWRAMEIAGGIIGENDTAGIWQLQPGYLVTGPRLSPWDASTSLHWASIVSDKRQVSVQPLHAVDERYVTRIVLS